MRKQIKRNIRIARYVIYRETIIDRSDIIHQQNETAFNVIFSFNYFF